MIRRIRVRNFAVARDVTVDLGAGLNVFTGETGAGKSLVVDALAFAFGARRGREVIASGAERAEVAVDVAGSGLLERSVGLAGRSALRLGAAPSTVDVVQALAADVIEIHGQSEQLAILRPSTQLAILDRFAGCGPLVAEMAEGVRRLRETRRTLDGIATDSRERERRLEQLRFEVEEIDSAALQPGEDDELRTEQSRLSSTARRLADAERALEALDASPLGEVLGAVASLAEHDPEAGDLHDTAVLLDAAAGDLARDLRRYRDGVEDDPARLAAVAERLDLLARLRRKYGERIEDVLTYAEEGREEITRLSGARASADELRMRERDLLGDLSRVAAALSAARRAAAGRLVQEVSTELGRLAMGGAGLAVGFACEDDTGGIAVTLPDYEVVTADAQGREVVGEPVARAFTESGVDRVEFLASFNPGEAPRPLGTVASGGETSRFLLALTTVFGAAASPRTVVLDEVDEGVGGRSGGLVGRALRRMAAHHQVICITHLPQVAAHGDRHFVVAKHTDGERTWSDIREVTGEERVDELATMLGGATDATRDAARDLLRDAPGESAAAV